MINLGRSLIVMALAWPIPAAGAFLDANDLYARCDVPSNTQQINVLRRLCRRSGGCPDVNESAMSARQSCS
jgi:hypothetical protein